VSDIRTCDLNLNVPQTTTVTNWFIIGSKDLWLLQWKFEQKIQSSQVNFTI